MPISVTRPNPWAPRTTRGRLPMMLSTFPPRSWTFSSLVTMTGGVPGGVIGLLDSANESSARASDSFLSVGQSRQDGPSTLSRTACQLAPTETTRWPPCLTQSTSDWPLSASSDLQHGAIVGVDHDAVGRVVSIPAAGHWHRPEVDPGDDHLGPAGADPGPWPPAAKPGRVGI